LYVNQNAGNVGIEIDDLNGSGTDANVGVVGNGIAMIAAGANKSGIGLTVQGSGSGQWQRGALLQNYAQFGLSLSTTTARASDLSIQPPADDSGGTYGYEISAANQAATAIVWSIDDVGNLNTAGNVTAASVTAGNGFTGTKTAGSCTFTIMAGIITNVTGC
jgi:hypothetical protein